jgi:septation ring formation regulator EzrA
MPYKRGPEAEHTRNCFRSIMNTLGDFYIQEIQQKRLEVLRTPDGTEYFVMRYLSKELMDAINKFAGDFSMKITVEFLVEFLKRSGENPIFSNSHAIRIPDEITDFFDTLELPEKDQKFFTPLLANSESKCKDERTRIDKVKASIDETSSSLENLKSENAKYFAELGSVKNSSTEIQEKLEALKKFSSSLEKMREVFGDAFVLPNMNPSLPTISDLEKEYSSLMDRMKILHDQQSDVHIKIMQAQTTLRTLENERMNAKTAEEKALSECKSIQLNIQRVKLGFSLRK